MDGELYTMNKEMIQKMGYTILATINKQTSKIEHSSIARKAKILSSK